MGRPMLNIPWSTSRMEQITVDAALTGASMEDDHAAVDATRKQASRRALVAFPRELWEQTAAAVPETLA
jgi:hypothetical protein